MDITVPKAVPRQAAAYRAIYERYVDDAAFLWVLRSVVVNQPHYYATDLAELEQRIQAQLDGLMTSIELGWEACAAALDLDEPGEVFTATVTAFRSHDLAKIQQAVDAGLATPTGTPGLISALGWLPAELVGPWVPKFLAGKDLRHKYLGVAACSVRREDPAEALTYILEREDCRQFPLLYARALRLVGELRRQDLMPAVQTARAAEEPILRFWALWSALLLGDRTAINDLQPFVLQSGPLQNRAIDLAFRVLPVEQGRSWISSLARDPAQTRPVVIATGILGDPHAVNWLIAKMADPKLARLAGEAFTNITGIDLERHQLMREMPTEVEAYPNDDPADTHVGLDPDENLAWPDADKVAALWRRHGQHFLVGRRYFLGRPLTPEWLNDKLSNGTQRQRHAAAMELALLGDKPLPNTRARIAS
jgi:uncharacterized protein (TIGR02270 family)